MSVTIVRCSKHGVHFGHQPVTGIQDGPFIFGHRSKIHIINLERPWPCTRMR